MKSKRNNKSAFGGMSRFVSIPFILWTMQKEKKTLWTTSLCSQCSNQDVVFSVRLLYYNNAVRLLVLLMFQLLMMM